MTNLKQNFENPAAGQKIGIVMPDPETDGYYVDYPSFDSKTQTYLAKNMGDAELSGEELRRLGLQEEAGDESIAFYRFEDFENLAKIAYNRTVYAGKQMVAKLREEPVTERPQDETQDINQVEMSYSALIQDMALLRPEAGPEQTEKMQAFQETLDSVHALAAYSIRMCMQNPALSGLPSPVDNTAPFGREDGQGIKYQPGAAEAHLHL